jgi:alkylation response protein AidB-like acyl-CoA dehydrogenase
MKFELTAEQTGFAKSLDDLLSRADTAAANRAWAAGDHEPGLKLWARLADLGVTVLAIEATPVEVCVAFEALGRHAVPGPWIESAAYLSLALADPSESMSTVAVPPHGPFAVDADVADAYVVVDGALHTATAGDVTESVDPTRRLFAVTAGDRVETGDLDAAFDLAVLATAAELLGAGERVLADSVAYVKQRTQFGRAIGSYQAIKHQLADVRIALDFARPLVLGAALDPTPRAVSAAKLQAADAADLAARVGLQVHGAIGYTEEYDLSLWLLRIRALQSAWGTSAFHRDRVLASLLADR